ncbi:SHQ1-domain-containing protein [Basidiobolus meristosporus CBS 931.73]|uniref:SHQ1-domain-containing protein n=1 Tax=Basidiobolus meristosporus CBS 931.73 TaxID=1314790 RepID=A0A1Y1Y7U1_9FUNG|nr:SHQ1-domain-containing protein [Basidiobolus meristosporus CBS 931.73]|eukprot:ORX94063.1 SHQ1-domain-containing protein [Basidiobolus meristosporus CBS 931.73]
MITPVFRVSQDADFVEIVIHAPHIKTQEVDFHVAGREFRFYVHPYFLRLNFPGALVEDERSTAAYDISSGDITVKIPKETPGEEFPDLDLLTKLIANNKPGTTEEPQKKGLIEVIEERSEMVQSNEEGPDFDWSLPQELAQPVSEVAITKFPYGFNKAYSEFFTHVHETANEINDLLEPENCSMEIRRRERIDCEDDKFDEDYYMYVEQSMLVLTTIIMPTISEELDRMRITEPLQFNEKEQGQMRNLPNREYLLENEKATYLGIIDLLFAYSYNHRANEGDNNVESCWIIGKLSSTLSCLEEFSTIREVLVASFRRSLAYPLYRNWKLSEKVMQDVYVILKLGKRAILKVLLELKDLFDHHDIYYIYSKLYLDDYCIWVQSASDKVLRSLAHELHHFTLTKKEIGWCLEELEEIALVAAEEGMVEYEVESQPTQQDVEDPMASEEVEELIAEPKVDTEETKKPLIEEMNVETQKPLIEEMNVETKKPLVEEMNVETEKPLVEEMNAEPNAETKKPLISEMNVEKKKPLIEELN